MAISKELYESINYGDRVLTITNRLINLDDSCIYFDIECTNEKHIINVNFRKTWGDVNIKEEIKSVLKPICKLKRKKIIVN